MTEKTIFNVVWKSNVDGERKNYAFAYLFE